MYGYKFGPVLLGISSSSAGASATSVEESWGAIHPSSQTGQNPSIGEGV